MIRDCSALPHLRPGGAGAGEERGREGGATDAEPARPGEACLGHDVSVDPADGAERGERGGVEERARPERLQRAHASRQQSLAAGLVGREGAALEEEDLEPTPGCSDGHGEAGGAAADDDEVVQPRHGLSSRAGASRRPRSISPALRPR